LQYKEQYLLMMLIIYWTV